MCSISTEHYILSNKTKQCNIFRVLKTSLLAIEILITEAFTFQSLQAKSEAVSSVFLQVSTVLLFIAIVYTIYPIQHQLMKANLSQSPTMSFSKKMLFSRLCSDGLFWLIIPCWKRHQYLIISFRAAGSPIQVFYDTSRRHKTRLDDL